MKSINPASFADISYCKEGKTAVFLLKLLQINLNQDLSEVLSVFMIIKIKAVSKKTALIYLKRLFITNVITFRKLNPETRQAYGKKELNKLHFQPEYSMKALKMH